MHSMHGLFRSQKLELGRDEDTGGQIVYVLELAKALGDLKDIDKVDIVTRRIVDPEYPGYSKIVEEVSPKVSIIRISCGPKKYIKKVNLWPYLDEFIGNVQKYTKKIRRKPDVLQSNYADSGLVCSKISEDINVPQVHTGHSLGISKMKGLGINKNNFYLYNKIFHFDKRLQAEQKVIDSADMIISSTREELKEQYEKYKIKKHMKKFRIIPPGIDLNKFYPPRKEEKDSEEIRCRELFNNVIEQGLKHPERRIVAFLSRLDKKKNLVRLVKAFAQDKPLQNMANLVVFAETLKGNKETQRIIKQINRLLNKYNLYDNIALPGIHLNYEKEVPAYYRYLAEKNGIFVNPALIEPFGLTIIEASACGVPVIATKHGGPSEIIINGVNGLLIDPKDPKDIASKIKKLIRHDELYRKISKNAIQLVRKHFIWKVSAKKYLKMFKEVINNRKKLKCT